MTPREKAERAQALLDDPVVRAVWHDIREGVVSKMEASPMDAYEVHHECALTLQVLLQVQNTLKRYAMEIEVDKHRAKQDSFMHKMREKLRP